jgi:hypothetical protein
MECWESNPRRQYEQIYLKAVVAYFYKTSMIYDNIFFLLLLMYP